MVRTEKREGTRLYRSAFEMPFIPSREASGSRLDQSLQAILLGTAPAHIRGLGVDGGHSRH